MRFLCCAAAPGTRVVIMPTTITAATQQCFRISRPHRMLTAIKKVCKPAAPERVAPAHGRVKYYPTLREKTDFQQNPTIDINPTRKRQPQSILSAPLHLRYPVAFGGHLRYLDRLQPLALLTMRLALGAVMVAHGYQNVFRHMKDHVHLVANLGMPAWLGYVSSFVEFIGGLLILTGFLTRAAAFAVCIDLI